VAFCEQDKFCHKVLKKHWPDIPIFDDVRSLTADKVANVLYNADITQEALDMANKRKDYSGAVDMYNNGFSIGETAAYFDVSRQAMWAILKRRGVEFREKLKFGNENHFFRGGVTACAHAHDVVEKAVLRGKIAKKPCEVCGADGRFSDGRSEVQAHHDDYNFPLTVRWLCQKHHHEWHKNNRPIEKKGGSPELTAAMSIDVVCGGFP
jgi:predicted DNA-binding protein YlxM (UPF0122 family)